MENSSVNVNRLLRLMQSTESCQVQGLFLLMFVENKTMIDVQSETGISRQTLSAWKKGGNVLHANVQKIAECYNVEPSGLYDAGLYLKQRINGKFSESESHLQKPMKSSEFQKAQKAL